MRNGVFVFLLAGLVLSGCAAQKQLAATGGSRADGTVKMSYEYGRLEVPKIDNAQGLSAARQRCAGWGYSGAEPFGGQEKTCIDMAGGGCSRWRVTIQYQCTGNPVASR